jgi:hypothetical protein
MENSMALELSFKWVCEYIKKDEPTVINAVDKLLGLTMICSPAFSGPAGAVLLPLLGVKDELVKLGKAVFETVVQKHDRHYIARQERMQAAYGLLCFTAFFEALDRQLPEELRRRIAITPADKLHILRKARKAVPEAEPLPLVAADVATSNSITSWTLAFPHPLEPLAEQELRHRSLWQHLAQGFRGFIEQLALWDDIDEKQKLQLTAPLEKLYEHAAVCFEAQYFELVRRYPDFAVWANLHEHKGAKELIGRLSEYVQRHTQLATAAARDIDIGFDQITELIRAIPATLEMARADDLVDGLRRHYNARLAEPIAEEKDDPAPGQTRLHFPRISEAFIPQAFRVLRHSSKTQRLEDENTWKELARRNDLGPFLVSYLSSPYSTESPLLILGHPGSGKSLLTTVLSARLLSEHYTPIRVPLREVDADAGIIGQIEERIRQVTSISVDSWAKLSGAFKNNPPVVILDGYDELLQASGRVFSGYLKDVQNFQRNEAEQGRPVRVIVTSRITLIDKAAIPNGSTIARLLEFDKRQRQRWIAIWNAANTRYFRASGVKPFALPKEGGDGATKVLALAEQPLLLLMLALYDSQENQLRKSKTLDRTFLYDSLLRRFVVREREKDPSFRSELSQADQKKEIESEMQRLGVAALGMYNRRKLHILASELNDDLRFFGTERTVTVAAGRPLTQAELLLGSFFFVHKSKAQLTTGAAEYHEESTAFEFLHNTFGEFLTADFILRQTFDEASALRALKDSDVLQPQYEQRLGSADGLSRAWFASLVYTPLYSRPVVLEMMREWVPHLLRRRQISRQVFLGILDSLLMAQMRRMLMKREMPSILRKEIAQEGFRPSFGDHPLLGHIAIYSVNLILLRAILDLEPFEFDEAAIGTHEDGARPWDRLTHIWRSWFSLENLNGVTAIMTAERAGQKIRVTSKEKFQVAEGRDRLDTHLNVAIAIGDNISTAVTSLLLFEPNRRNRVALSDIERRLEAERVDLRVKVAVRELQAIESRLPEGIQEFAAAARKAIELGVSAGSVGDIELVMSSVRRGIRWLAQSAVYEVGGVMGERLIEIFREIADPRIIVEAMRRNANVARLAIEAATEVADWVWLREFGMRLSEWVARESFERFERRDERTLAMLDALHLIAELDMFVGPYLDEVVENLFHPRFIEDLSHAHPATMVAWLRFVRKVGARARSHGREMVARMLRHEDPLRVVGENAAAALLWLSVASESDEYDLSAEGWDDVLTRIWRKSDLRHAAELTPELGFEWLHLAVKAGARRAIDEVGRELLDRMFAPSRYTPLISRESGDVVRWLRLVSEVEGGAVASRYFTDILHRFGLSEVVQRNPVAILAFPEIAAALREALRPDGSDEIFDRVSGHALKTMLIENPLGFAALLRLAHIWRSVRGAELMLLAVADAAEGRSAAALELLPSSAIRDLAWAHEITGMKPPAVVRAFLRMLTLADGAEDAF